MIPRPTKPGGRYGRRFLSGIVAALIALAVTTVSVPTAVAAGTDAPGNVTASPGNAAATVTWTAPASPTATVSNYTVATLDSTGTPVNPPITVTTTDGTVTTATITGLTNGTSYKFNVTANYPTTTAVSDPSATITAGAPVAPTAVTPLPGDGIVTVTWAVPADNGSPIATYLVTIYQGVTPVATLVTVTPAATVGGLVNGTTYTARVTATNANGVSPEGVSPPFTPAGLPSAPGTVSAVPGIGQATVSWGAATANGSALTNYTVTPMIGGVPQGALAVTVSGNPPATTTTVTGLTNGTPYTFSVVATNGVGNSTASVSATPITPLDVPNVPTGVTGTPGNQSAVVSWSAPVVDPTRAAVTGYRVIPFDVVASTALAPVDVTNPAATSASVTGLTNGTTYTFTVVATSAMGDSAVSTASGSVIPAPQPPDAPTNVQAVVGNETATVSWTAAVTNGSPVTGYLVVPTIVSSATALPAVTAGATDTSVQVTGLANGVAYTFTVVATSDAGNSAASVASAPVIPSAAPPSVPVITQVVAGNGSAVVTWSASTTNGTPVTGYRVVPSSGTPVEVPAGTTSATVTGLTNGTSYTFTVIAHSTAGDSAPSTVSSAVVPGTPMAPTDVVAIAGVNSATVQWDAANANGATGITYTVIATGGVVPLTVSNVTGTSIVFPNLVNGTGYSFTVIATGTAGATPVSSPASTPSAVVTPLDVPAAPTIGTAVPANGSVTVSWSAPATDPTRAAVTGYLVIPSVGTPVDVPADATSVTVIGLTNGTAYTFTVVATSAVGNSAASESVTATPAISPVWEYYLALGGAATLGQPLGAESAPTLGGLAQEFAGGSIYWTETTGAHLVKGAILAKYTSIGGPAGILGYPTTDETGTPDGVGRYNHFTGTGGASIYWTPSTGAHAIYGAIRLKWASMGWERSVLGYPTTDEFSVPGGRRNNFVHGSITWLAGTNAIIVVVN